MSELEIRPDGGRTTFEPGEEIAGTVAWRGAEAPATVELRLFWWTSGKGTRDLEVVAQQTFEAPLPRDERPFRLRLPTTPVSFSGGLITLSWGLELVAEPDTESVRCDLVVAPGGRELDISGVREW